MAQLLVTAGRIVYYRVVFGGTNVLYFRSEAKMIQWIASLDYLNETVKLEISTFIFDD